MPSRAEESADESLKRLGGGRWQTRDERFTIEPQSGTWAVVDAEQTDDLGLPLVRGPFGSLTAARPRSPRPARARRRPRRSPIASSGAASGRDEARGAEPTGKPSSKARSAKTAPAERDSGKRSTGTGQRTAPRDDVEEEPGWLRDLAPADRGRARRLIDRLTAAGDRDAVGIVRRDLVGGVPAIAAHAIARRLADLPSDASPAVVVELLAEGRDDELGVRWRIVDGDGRPILIELPKRGRG